METSSNRLKRHFMAYFNPNLNLRLKAMGICLLKALTFQLSTEKDQISYHMHELKYLFNAQYFSFMCQMYINSIR